jgi:hypothetical protein
MYIPENFGQAPESLYFRVQLHRMIFLIKKPDIIVVKMGMDI